jgi:adenylate cyclase
MDTTKKSEIKYCVIEFAEICGFDDLEEPMDPEEYAQFLKDIAALFDKAVALYEGHVDKHEGKVLMATFGVPIAHEEDPERAIRSALLFRNSLEEYCQQNSHRLSTKTGIHLGKVFAGDVGSEIKKEYTVMGDAVNIAARITERLDLSAIGVSEEIYRITKPVFQFSPGQEHVFQGMSRPVIVYTVVGQKTGFIKRRGIEGLQSPLIGRNDQLLQLEHDINGLFKGKGKTIILIGEAGVGKSRLIEELLSYSLSRGLEQAKVVNWCSGYCSPYKETMYLPFIEIIKQICGIEPGDSEKTIQEKLLTSINTLTKDQADEIYPYAAHLLNIELSAHHAQKMKYLEPQAVKLQIHIAITTLMQNYAMQQPCVYVVDDLYLADMSTLEALKFVLETMKPTPSLLILISRPEKEKPFWHLQEQFVEKENVDLLYLKPLSSDHVTEISENLLKIPRLPRSLVEDMVRKADGNPFFLEEIIKLLIAKKILYKKGREWLATDQKIEFSIPYTIAAIIRTRFDTLDRVVKNTLEEMSVIGRIFSKKIIKVMTAQWENLDTILRDIVNLGFVSTSDEEDFSFNHALVREVIYNSIPEKRRNDLHLKIADTIETMYSDRKMEFCELLFEHYFHAGKHKQVVEYGLEAGARARRRYANDEAIQYYKTVLDTLDTIDGTSEKRYGVLYALGRLHSTIGKNSEALEFFEQALELSADTKQEAEIYNAIADTYQSISDYDKAIEIYKTALDKMQRGSLIDRSSIEIGIAWINYLQGDYTKARQILDNIQDNLQDASNIEARQILARVFNILASIFAHTGDRDRSFEYYSKSLRLYEILDDIGGQSVIYNNICSYHTDKGDYNSALEGLQRSLVLAQKTGNILSQAITTYNIGDTYYQLGDFEKARKYYDQYMEINKNINNRLGLGYGTWGIGMLEYEKDNISKAQDMFTEAETIFKELGGRIMQYNVQVSLADIAVGQGDFKKAEKICNTVITAAKEINAQEIIIECMLTITKMRLAQAQKEKKLAISYYQDAQKNLLEIQTMIENMASGKETEFMLYSLLAEVYYNLGQPKKTMDCAQKAGEIVEEILQFIPAPEVQKTFLQRKIFKAFNEFKNKVKL